MEFTPHEKRASNFQLKLRLIWRLRSVSTRWIFTDRPNLRTESNFCLLCRAHSDRTNDEVSDCWTRHPFLTSVKR